MTNPESIGGVGLLDPYLYSPAQGNFVYKFNKLVGNSNGDFNLSVWGATATPEESWGKGNNVDFGIMNSKVSNYSSFLTHSQLAVDSDVMAEMLIQVFGAK